MSEGHPDRQRSPRGEGVCKDVRATQELGDVQVLPRDLGSRIDKVLEKAETMGLRFPTDYKDRLYYTTLGTGVCVPFEPCRIARDYYCCCTSSGLSLEVLTKSCRVM